MSFSDVKVDMSVMSEELMEDTYWGKLKTLTVLQEDESLLNDFDSIFIVNPDENKAAEKPVEEKKKKKTYVSE